MAPIGKNHTNHANIARNLIPRWGWAFRSRQPIPLQSDPLGILKIHDNNFDAAFEEIRGSWLNNGLEAAPVLPCGMIGSRQGWLEAPYVPCPASIDHLARKFVSLTTKKGRRVTIIAEPVLANRYQRALGYSGISATIADENVTAIGLFRLAQAANLLQ